MIHSPSTSSSIDHPNNSCWRVQTVMLLIVYFCHPITFCLLYSNISCSQTPSVSLCAPHFRFMFSDLVMPFYCHIPSFTFIESQYFIVYHLDRGVIYVHSFHILFRIKLCISWAVQCSDLHVVQPRILYSVYEETFFKYLQILSKFFFTLNYPVLIWFIVSQFVGPVAQSV